MYHAESGGQSPDMSRDRREPTPEEIRAAGPCPIYQPLDAEEILNLIPRDEVQALLAGAPDRLDRPAKPDDLDALRERLEPLQAAMGDAPAATTSQEEAQSWDHGADLDDAAELVADDAEDQL